MFTWALENDVELPTLMRTMAEAPARLFGIGRRKGTLNPGMDADIILVDPAVRRTVDAAKIWPDVCSNPLAGASLAGWPQTTISRGEVVWDDGAFTVSGRRGQAVPQIPRKRR
jgi:dihydropyrimidinase